MGIVVYASQLMFALVIVVCILQDRHHKNYNKVDTYANMLNGRIWKKTICQNPFALSVIHVKSECTNKVCTLV